MSWGGHFALLSGYSSFDRGIYLFNDVEGRDDIMPVNRYDMPLTDGHETTCY